MALLLGGQRRYHDKIEGKEDHLRDTSVGVDLLKDLVDVRGVRLDPLLGSLLSALGLGSRGFSGLMSVGDIAKRQGRVNIGSP